jgi:type II secretory pathway pseudopilin PulG
MKKLPRIKRYKAYTLLEMLIVLTLFIILSALGMSAFEGFRDTISLNEDIDKLKQTVRSAQRSALFLERGSNERWLYGIGIDFTQLDNNGTYRLFKWCAPFNEYGDIRSKQSVPHFIPTSALGPSNGNLPTMYSPSTSCLKDEGTSEKIRLQGSVDIEIGSNFVPTILESGSATTPAYVLFESVSGKAFFYNAAQGLVLNYSSNGTLVSNPNNLVIEVRAPNTGRLKTITIYNISGRVKVEDSKL